MKLYWEQHKVFFIATLALFPDKLKGHEVNELFYRPYFVGENTEFIEHELDEYRKNGYIKYEKSDALYKITDIASQKAKKDLMQYLRQWQGDELLALSASKPPDSERQNELLLAAIVRDYPDHKNMQRINLENIYGKPSEYAYKPPFWELVLAYQLLDKKITIAYMDYDRREDGLYDDDGQPTVDIKIIDKELVSLLEQRVALDTKFVRPTSTLNRITLRSYDATSGTLFFGNHEVKIIRQKSRQGNAVGETTQGSAMRKLFKDVNTLQNGVLLRNIISVRYENFDSRKRKQATNNLDEINRKIKKETGVPKLIIYDKVNYYIGKSYLE